MEKSTRVAIHANQGTSSNKWILYCQRHHIPYKIVNCYQNDIIGQLKDCSALLWHYHHTSIKDRLFAKELLFALEQSGMQVFPNFNTAWFFDDKLGQKYLLESVGAPLANSYVFYTKKQALTWAKNAAFPKVFKLRCGAGSSNVRLVGSSGHARRLIRKAFGPGFQPVNRWYRLLEGIRNYRHSPRGVRMLVHGLYRAAVPMRYARRRERERGYVYFQDFIPGNDSDMRVIIVGKKAFVAKRMVRHKDFRASGSGVFNFNREIVNTQAIQIAFETVSKLQAQCLAFDFVFNENKQPLILEMSYGFCSTYDQCQGYWTPELKWVDKNYSPQELMIETILSTRPGEEAPPEQWIRHS